MQQLRLFVPLHIKESREQITREKKVIYNLTDLIDQQNNILKKQGNNKRLTRDEVQTAINCVLTASKAPVLDWQTDLHVEITEQDARKIATYTASSTPLQGEREILGLSIDYVFLEEACKDLL